MRKYHREYHPTIGEEPITIKIRVDSGCFHRDHSPFAYSLIDQELSQIPDEERCFDFIEHESGPEILIYVAAATAIISLTEKLISLVTAIINARAKGREAGDHANGKLLLIVRDTHRTDSSTEDFVLEIYDKEIVSSKQVKQALEKGIKNRIKPGGK